MAENGKSETFVPRHLDLIEACKKGNRKAQFELYRLYHAAMYNTTLRIVGDSDDAEDVMQEAFLKAFTKLGTYRKEVSFGAWLKRIVINKSLDFLRLKKEQPGKSGRWWKSHPEPEMWNTGLKRSKKRSTTFRKVTGLFFP